MVNIRSGHSNWTFGPASNAVVGGDVVYISSVQSGHADLIALDRGTGHILWRKPSEPDSLVASDLGVVIGNQKGITRFGRDGNVLWHDAPVENLKELLLVAHRFVIASGIESGSSLHSVATIIDFKSGAFVSTSTFGDPLEITPSSVFAETYSVSNNFDTWCGNADITSIRFSKSGIPNASTIRYIFEDIPDNVQSTPCINDRNGIPKATLADNTLVLTSGMITAVFEIGDPSRARKIFTKESFVGGAYGNVVALNDKSGLRLYDISSNRSVSVPGSVSANVATAAVRNHIFVSIGNELIEYDSSTLRELGRYPARCARIMGIGRSANDDVIQCIEEGDENMFTLYSLSH
jgi:outer membrane protein assembly factor BamB